MAKKPRASKKTSTKPPPEDRRIVALKQRKQRLVADICAMKAESAQIASQLVKAGFTDYAACW